MEEQSVMEGFFFFLFVFIALLAGAWPKCTGDFDHFLM